LRYSQNYDFCLHDLDLFEQALRAQDLVDEISGIVASEGLVVGGKPHPMLGALRDARQTALRYWRACGFKGEDEPTRRPGRPSGDAWSASRKAAALRLQRQQGGGGA
jgi:hypothetical protein